MVVVQLVYVEPFNRALDKSKAQGGPDSKDAVILRDGNNQHIAAHTFAFRELAAATKNFRQDCLLGEGGFGRVYKGRLENGQVCDSKCFDASEFHFSYIDPLVFYDMVDT